MALSLVLSVGVLVGALSVGVFLTLRTGDDPPPPTTSSTTLSAPEGSIAVADVSGMSEDAARNALGEQVEVDVVTVPGSAEQNGIVQGTQPAAGSFVMPGKTVILEVATELATQPLSALPANTAGGRTEQGSVTVDGTSASDAIVVQANKPEVQVTYMLQQRYTSVDADLVVPDDGTPVQVRVEVDGTTQVEQTVAPGGSVPVTVDVTDAQRLTITVTASDESTPPRFAFTDGVLGGEAGTVPNT
ncbi:NPCBM/NEW2 domain-containing protein [Brachybacterium sp. UNK5269]|uniref:NPCBM/NEW2 domain-containing protein n=1 Tax=Brachybacterium sp. UNK5269 TaxID=3408576 RepID=UPI003BAE7A76